MTVFQRLNHAYRIFATAICYALFGILGLLIWTIGFPLITVLLPRHQRLQSAHKLARSVFRFFIGWMRLLGVLSFEFVNDSNLNRPGSIIIANHPSLLDIVFLISRVSNAVCIVRKDLMRNLFMRSAIKHCGYVINDHADLLVNDCTEVLDQSMTLIIFPQGTRSPLNEVFKFQRGMARIALHTDADIIPVFIECDPPHLRKGEPWYCVPVRPPHYRLIVGDKINPKEHVDSDLPSIASRQLTRFLENHFVEQYHFARQSAV
ncbi:MAG: 1-acyl-sn-glycerol-3-phosphate acyltransferase [Gammaproteobacteria bacterium]|nr:1-acyl-sn-glycerol-3-phosphate acyltransferase [Gammaproteobacteria bacterium]